MRPVRICLHSRHDSFRAFPFPPRFIQTAPNPHGCNKAERRTARFCMNRSARGRPRSLGPQSPGSRSLSSRSLGTIARLAVAQDGHGGSAHGRAARGRPARGRPAHSRSGAAHGRSAHGRPAQLTVARGRPMAARLTVAQLSSRSRGSRLLRTAHGRSARGRRITVARLTAAQPAVAQLTVAQGGPWPRGSQSPSSAQGRTGSPANDGLHSRQPMGSPPMRCSQSANDGGSTATQAENLREWFCFARGKIPNAMMFDPLRRRAAAARCDCPLESRARHQPSRSRKS